MTFVITDFHPSPTGFFSHGDGHHATHHHSHHRHEQSGFPPNYQKHTESSTKKAEQRSCFDCIKKNIETVPAFVNAVGKCKEKAEGKAEGKAEEEAKCVERAIKNTIKSRDVKRDLATKCGDVCSKEVKNPRRITYKENGRGSLPGFTSNVASFVGSMLAHAANAAATGFI